MMKKQKTSQWAESNYIASVAEFHTKFRHPVLPNPTIPGKDRCALRVSLIAEELKELEEAIEANDLVEVADALADIQYVLSGAVCEFGMANVFKDMFEEVHRSNMSKKCVKAWTRVSGQNHGRAAAGSRQPALWIRELLPLSWPPSPEARIP